MEDLCVRKSKAFEGTVKYCTHRSEVTNTDMTFGLFEPGQEPLPVPVLWLSGLTCTHENFLTKAGALRIAQEHNILLIVPDTSPRGLDLPGEHYSWDFGSGAGFYLNATQEPWSGHYRMYDYIVKELVPMVVASYGVKGKLPIIGHSMGGHGALVIGLRNPEVFSSISAFAPILNPVNCAWGKKAFSSYLGDDITKWEEYDATHLVQKGVGKELPLMIDQGQEDQFLEEQLGLPAFTDMCKEVRREVQVNMRPGYDHGYYYISSFIEEHMKWHLERL